MVTDCSAVVTHMALKRSDATKHSNTMAGVMRGMDASMVEQVAKTKAHRTAEQAAAQGLAEVVAHRRNEWVDSIAKRGAMDGIADTQAAKEAVTNLEQQVHRLRCLAAVLGLSGWPAVVGTDIVPWSSSRMSNNFQRHNFTFRVALQA